ncbi:helix-turn-helix transcriptional regulator [Methylophilus sp. QUAN]|uniref:helix-turn-helix transcriptional regulator n=1 Tax=Methylophilus sp. QUAN TaxID=2781020 RepID=UPI00188E0017|nr:helix-turn-helix transcriptional regulator [Methylophilus sp. QUAN]MBF4990383.1 helix-turn-helix transcriptional regulator [Methylophilus sp. QUAN]
MQTTSDMQYLELVGEIYDAALKPEKWPEILQKLGQFMQSSKAVLFTNLHLPSQGGFYFTWGIPQAVTQQYVDHYQPHDVWTQVGIQKEIFYEGKVTLGTELVPHQQFLESKIWRELLVQADMARLCTGVVFGIDNQYAMPVGVSLFRGVNDPSFDEQDRQKLQRLLRHFSRALGVMFQLRDADLQIAASRTALDGLRSGVILLNANSEILLANQAAQRILQSQDGLTTSEKNTLTTNCAETQSAIEQILQTCLQHDLMEVPHFSQSIAINRTSGKAAYKLFFSRLPEHHDFVAVPSTHHAMLFITDTEQPLKLSVELLKTTYGLTDAEVKLAQQCLVNDSMPALTTALNLSENTIKTQLASIYQKCGIHHRAELMKVLMALATD